MYLAPGFSVPAFDSFCDIFINAIDNVLTQLPHHRLIVAGDFNQYNRTFLTSHLSLHNIVIGATRIDACLDQIFVDKEIFIMYKSENVSIGPPVGNSDHRSIFASIHGTKKRRTIKKHVLWDLRLSHLLKFEQNFLAHDFESFYSCKDIEETCQMFYEFLNDAMKVIPQHTILITSTDAPWITPLIKFMIDERWKAFRSRNWSQYKVLKSKINEEIWRAKKILFLAEIKVG